jgi:ubiquinone biosynthesis protein COQ9
VRVAGLTAIYAKVFEVWLDDTSPSLDKTMAALDKRLARGERMLNRAETACADVCRIACGFLSRGWKRGERADEAPPRPAPPAPSASAPA